jgi:hypothetical protein
MYTTSMAMKGGKLLERALRAGSFLQRYIRFVPATSLCLPLAEQLASWI